MGLLFEIVANRVLFNLSIVLGIAFICFLIIRQAFKKRYSLQDEFLEREMQANSARRRDVEPELFYTSNIENFPFKNNAEGSLLKKQEHVKNCSKLTMVRFPEKKTNLELKHAYGVANLEKITGYEENYMRYINSLVEWADALLENGAEEDAVTVFEETVTLGSEYTKTYTRLADYYAKKNDAEKLNYLIDKVVGVFSDEGIKKKTTQYIMDKKEEL